MHPVNMEEIARHYLRTFERCGCCGFWLEEYGTLLLPDLIGRLQAKKDMRLTRLIGNLRRLQAQLGG